VNATKYFNRALVNLLLLIAVSHILGARGMAQSPPRRLAVFTPGLSLTPVFDGLQEGLLHYGYMHGKNITFIVEDTEGDSENPLPGAQKLVAEKPDALFVVTTAYARAAKQATTTVPIVFSFVGDPVQDGLVASFPSSKNNLTGVMTGADALSGKRLEVLLEVAPKTKRVLALVTSKASVALSSFRFLERTAVKRRIELVRRDVSTEEEIRKALQETAKGSVQAIYYVPSTFMRSYVRLLNEKAKADKIPVVVHDDRLVEDGALVSYGPSLKSIGAQAARLVAKILKGEKPSAIPSEVPDRLILAINLRTASEIGLKISPEVLGRADRLVK
jgi:putative ABC transport system substrate-binding protein